MNREHLLCYINSSPNIQKHRTKENLKASELKNLKSAEVDILKAAKVKI
jgi:hypothetical protein